MAASHARASMPVDTSDRELVVTRVFDAPRDLVFSAWTDPAHLVHWWGPDGFTLTIHEMDVKPGGVWRFVMHGPDGRNYGNSIVYVEVARPGRLVYKHVPGPGDEPVRFDVTVTFEEQDGKTHLTMQMVFPSKVARDHIVKTYGAEEGAKQTLGRLAGYVTEMLRRN